MKRNVAVIGTGQTVTKMRREDVDFPGLCFEAVSGALDDAGITLEDVDAVVFGSSPEYFEGVNAPEKWCLEASGGYMKPHFRVHTGGTVGASTGISGYYHVASGMYDTVLAITGDKLSEGEVQLCLSTVYDPIFGRDFACGAPSAVAMQARQYQSKYGITDEQVAKVAVYCRKNAQNNPYAQLQLDLTVEQVLSSPPISTPIKLLEACPASDGAAAMVFTSEDNVKKKYKDQPVAWVKGVSAMAEGTMYTYRSWAEPIALLTAAQRAYYQAGITNPRRQLDAVEMYNAFAVQDLIWAEGLGLCNRGDGGNLIDSGAMYMDGDIPCNPSGGVISGNTIGATAMVRQVEACLQVMGKADKRQVPGATTALAHGWGGAIQFQTVMIVSNKL